MISVRGNHEDHLWFDALELRSQGIAFPIDIYQRVYNLKTGTLWTFQKGNEQITVLGIGRVAPPAGEVDRQQGKYIQGYEKARLAQLKQPFDILLTHDARPDFVLLERGVKVKGSTGMQEIGKLLDKTQPAYHFFGHYGGPPQVRTDSNGVTCSIKLADLHWERGSSVLESGSMGLLRWQSREQHSFTLLDVPWLKEYTTHTWRYL